MRTVYAVEYGEYSDRGVDCLFETRELAEEYISTVRANYHANRPSGYSYWLEREVVEYQLWDVVPALANEMYRTARPGEEKFYTLVGNEYVRVGSEPVV